MCTKTLEKENSKWKWKWICPTTGEICNGLDIQQRPNCHYIEEYAIILVEAVAKKKKILTSILLFLYFYESEISRLWLAMAAGPGPVNQPSRSRSELPTSNYPSNWMLCLTLMMTLMNKQTKQTASAACESLSPLLPPTKTMLLHLLRLHLHLVLGLALCACCLRWPLDDDVCQRANESVCCWGDEKGRDVVRRLRVPLISFITTHKSSWFFIFYILKRRKYTTTAR